MWGKGGIKVLGAGWMGEAQRPRASQDHKLVTPGEQMTDFNPSPLLPPSDGTRTCNSSQGGLVDGVREAGGQESSGLGESSAGGQSGLSCLG